MFGRRKLRNQVPGLYATRSEFRRIFEKDMNSLYLLSFLLTGDRTIAEQCFVGGLHSAQNGNQVFKEWAEFWARRAIIQNAIRMIRPRKAADSTHLTSDPSTSNALTEHGEFAGIADLPAFERFAFVMSGLERYSEQECSLLLGCTRGDVAEARTRALERLITPGEVAASAAWNLDFWGKYRRATEAARANLLANRWAQKEVMATLVANLATSYFQLRQLDLELEISRRTLSSRSDSLQLSQTLEQHGINSMLDVRQSEQLVYTAATEIPDFERQIAQQENAISILLGNNPGDVPRGLKLTEQPHAPEVPVGLPSSLLERRPDIREAEGNLIAANAQIGVARAAYFPQISLTGTAGYESPALTNLFTGPAGVWNLAASLTQPIFEGGRLKSNVRLTEAQRDQMVLTYQQTIQGAFRDVSNALVAYRKDQEFTAQQQHLFESAQDAARLSEVRFKAGTTDYLEVLTNETNSLTAELGLAQARGNELIALVQLYQALGGGWQ